MALIHTAAYTHPSGTSGFSGCSASTLGQFVTFLWERMWFYWYDSVSPITTGQFIITETPVTGASAYEVYLNTTPDPDQYQVQFRATVSFVTSDPLGSGYITTVDETLGANDLRINFGMEDTSEILYFGYQTCTTADGTPSAAYGNNPASIMATWNAMLGSGGLDNEIFVLSAMTGNAGWLDRFYSPYLGIKQAMKIYNDAQFTSAGWTTAVMTSSQAEPWLPNSATTALIPVDTGYASTNYADVYNDISEYMYGTSSSLTYLTDLYTHMLRYNTLLNGSATCGTAQQAYISNAGVASYSAASAFIEADQAAYTCGVPYVALFTGDEDSIAGPFRNTQSIAQLRLSWDKDHVKIPLSSFDAGSGAIWDNGTKFVMLYLMHLHTDYDVVRTIISG